MTKLTSALALLALAACAGAPSAPPAEAERASAAARDDAAASRLASFFGATKGARTVMASEVQATLAQGKYFIADVRPAADYAKGHIPGAVSLPLDQLFTQASLARLPPPGGKPILLVCQTGHTASMALGGLAALGYQPWVLRWSMLAWNAHSEVKIASPAETPQPLLGLGGPVER